MLWNQRPSRRLPFTQPLIPVLLVTFVCAGAKGDARQVPEGPRFKTSSAAVVVDVVVRDQQERPVSGLIATDFDVYEEGVRQTITTFDALNETDDRAALARGRSGAAVAPAAATARVPAVVALAFEQLSPGGRQLAQKAATGFVTNTLTHGDYAGIFHVDRAVHVMVPYTNDAAALQKGVRDASSRPGYALERAGAVPGAEFGAPGAGQQSSSSQDDSPFIRGHATFDALERLIDSMQALPGRKAVILFSEGLALRLDPITHDSWLEDTRHAHFLRVIERANGAHVAMYTFDAAGLRIESPLVERGCFGCAPYVGLQMLADQTGGAFVENTNDLVKAVGRVGADLRDYYLLGYNSTNPALDNTYRRIEVKVHREKVRVLARQGYLASPQPNSVPVRTDEVGPLLTLDNPHVPNAFPFQVGTLAFPEADRPGRTAILAQVPANGLGWADADGSQSAAVTVMARVKDAKGRVLSHVTERFDLTRAATDDPGEILFYKETDLAPGVYTLEVVAYDARTDKASVRLATVDVPKPLARGPRISSLFLVRSATRATAEAKASASPRFGDWFLTPNLGDPVLPGSELAFAFAVVPASGRSGLSASVTVLKNAGQMAAAPIELAPPGADGRITYVGRIPLPSLGPGTYQLAVTVFDSGTTVAQLATFRVARQSAK